MHRLLSPIVICLVIFAFTNGHPIPTYFARLHEDGSLMDMNSPDYRLKIDFVDLENPSSEILGIAHQERKAYIKVLPDIVENGAEVEVFWRSHNNTSKKDFIALYCPYDGDPSSYLDFLFLNETRSTFAGGEGKFKVKLYNMRVDCELRYFLNDGRNAYLISRSNRIRFKSNEPLQGHLALTGNPSEMRVMWTSGTDSMPVVLYGINQTSLSMKASGNSSTYKAKDMCGEPANGIGFREPGFIHDALLTGLKPGVKYFFQYGSAEAMSKIYNFTAAPVPGKDVPIKFVAYGDMGVTPSPGSVITARESLKEVKRGAQLILHVGDISYARGYAYLWDQWHALIEPYATLVPYMVGIGNHEQDHLTGGSKDPSGAPGEGFHPSWGNFGDDSGGECGVPMYKRFHMPENGNALWWYSFDYGSVHFVMMSTEHNFTKGSVQYKWLVQDLENVDRSITPWIVFMGHRPMYTSQLVLNRDPIVASHMREEFEDVLYKYKVDLTLWGHYHSYERTCPVYREECVPDGPTYMVVGTAGYILSFNLPFWTGKKWSLHHEVHYGYGRVTVVNSTAMYWEWIKNYNQEVKDKVWIYRKDS